MTTVGFVTIVKNEAHVIRRCLDSIRPFTDYVLISDTGSTDGTQAVIRRWLAENRLAGELIERPWRDFAHNRNEALEALRQITWIDYALTIDADEYLVRDEGFDLDAFRQSLPAADCYRVTTREGTYHFSRLQLFSNRLPFHYLDPLHERLLAPPGAVRATVRGFYNQYTREGGSWLDPRKHYERAELCERVIASEQNPDRIARFTFHLAQSFLDAGEYEKALTQFLKRAGMGGRVEDVGLSYLAAGRLMEQLGQPADLVIATYLKAYEAIPVHADPLYLAARRARLAQYYQHGYLLAQAGLDRPQPEGIVADSAVYTWKMLDEFQMLACYVGRFDEAVEASERLLSEAAFPEAERERIERNAALALEKYDEMEGADAVLAAETA